MVGQVACVQLLRYKKDDVKKDMKFLKKDKKDPGCPWQCLHSSKRSTVSDRYHFEEFSSPSIGLQPHTSSKSAQLEDASSKRDCPQLRQYGIWEVPGDDVLRPMWPMFYRLCGPEREIRNF